jgi:hypothetical protein
MLDRSWSVASCALALLLLAGRPAAGAENVEELLPANTQQFLVLHIKQLTTSEAYKKHAAEPINALLALDEVKDLLNQAALVPLKDVERVVLAGPAPFNPMKADGMIVLCGKFDKTKLALTALAAAKKYKDNVAIVKDGPYLLVKLTGGDLLQKQECYAAVVDAGRIIISPKQEEVRAALDRAADKKAPVVKDKALLKALAAIDAEVTVVGRLDRAQLRPLWGPEDQLATRLVEKVNFATVEVRVASDITLTVTVEMKDTAAVGTMRGALAQIAEQVKTLTGLFALTEPRAKPLAEAAQTLKVSTKNRSVIVQGRASADVLGALVKLAGQ